MEIRSILPVYSNTKIITIHYIYNIFIRITRAPGGPATRILSTIDHESFTKKFKEFEAAFFEVLMNSFHMLIKSISHNLWTTGKVYQQFSIIEIFVSK